MGQVLWVNCQFAEAKLVKRLEDEAPRPRLAQSARVWKSHIARRMSVKSSWPPSAQHVSLHTQTALNPVIVPHGNSMPAALVPAQAFTLPRNCMPLRMAVVARGAEERPVRPP